MKHLLLAALLLFCISASAFRSDTEKGRRAKARQTASQITSQVNPDILKKEASKTASIHVL